MVKALKMIDLYKNGNKKILKPEIWLRYLAISEEPHINMERINSMDELKENPVLNYVEKTLRILDTIDIPQHDKSLIEEVLKWSEVAKGGNSLIRRRWEESGYNLFVHNIGSAQIYLNENNNSHSDMVDIIYTLIYTHGLIGQALRGEVSFKDTEIVKQLIDLKYIDKYRLHKILLALNHCIIGGVSEVLWDKLSHEINDKINSILNGSIQEYSLKERLRKLRSISIENGEDFDLEYSKYVEGNKDVKNLFKRFFMFSDLWYVESALHDFSFEEFIKIFSIIFYQVKTNTIKHISFEKLMNGLYYQHKDKKKINIYKKRIIEKFLSLHTIDDILQGKIKSNPHLEPIVNISLYDTLFFDFKFSPAGEKLIDFCVEAEKSDTLYEQAIILLFDLFELRRDKYDRFHNEQDYLQIMNKSIDYKKIILDYIVGNNVLDIGPGGGALMNLMEENLPDKNIKGIDFSKNVIEELKKKKNKEGHKWDVIYGDALALSDCIEEGSVDSIIFCSIIHELYSYIEYNGKKFNHDTIATALRSAFKVLSKGGRIIIRDGIMTEPEDQKRIIRFLSNEGMAFLEKYSKDFKGRQIQYQVIGQNEVVMPINDAMEFLYTYTWGEESYVHEVNEQFGYFTPSQYVNFIKEVLGEEAEIIECKHFLQEGYTIALSQIIEFFDENRNEIRLPDSTCLIVIQKK